MVITSEQINIGIKNGSIKINEIKVLSTYDLGGFSGGGENWYIVVSDNKNGISFFSNDGILKTIFKHKEDAMQSYLLAVGENIT